MIVRTPQERHLHPAFSLSAFVRRRGMHGHKSRLNGATYSSIADWFALNSNELTWIALVTVGVIAVGMSM
jgi:hypothetical protein